MHLRHFFSAAVVMSGLLVNLAIADDEALSGAAPTAPWSIPDDPATAIRDPDRFAWQLFRALTWPADIDSRKADPEMPYGSEGPVVFQTWILADAVCLDEGGEPAPWTAFKPETMIELDGTDGRANSPWCAIFRPFHPVPRAIRPMRSG